MKLNEKQTNIFLFAAQGVGAIFGGIFLTAYFGGLLEAYLADLPLTNTFNSDPTFVLLQSVIGAILIAFMVIALILAVIVKQKD